MQLVRTITGSYERTLQRKLTEIFFAVCLSQRIPKNRLPILYLWVGYYGWRMNNFKQACLRLQIDPKTVSGLEAAKLVARLKYPEPQKCDAERSRIIHNRGLHLIRLTNRMSTHIGLYTERLNETIQDYNLSRKTG